ncbi:hypothetical protein D9615_001049 [Tricholomella constricta]|uniref:F-box domain-containing protein n=1 Tax=Tricholomella constricta TaxID=117010 RepID=A0A8H5M8F6_9AGAR|nr:hypothetical protein D9615_001049 [Tricholomella constricta]
MEAESSKMGAARTLRPRKKRKSDTVATYIEQDPGYQETKILKKAPRKRAKGRLAGLIDLPFDVLFEIFGHLNPYELLKLARMTKEFRRLLMHRSTKSVWKAALDQIQGLPACPPEMSEPAWVNLAFDPHCHFCFTTNIRVVEWSFRVRICSKCAKDQVEEVYMPDILPIEAIEHFPYQTLLPSRPGKRGSRGILISEYEKVKEQYEATEGNDARNAFILERRKFVSDIQKHSSICTAWARTQTFDRSYELQQMRTDRRLAIIAKLEALGYAEDVAGIRFPDSLGDHDLVKKPQKLTDRVWSNIKGPIIDFMEEMRVKRLAREHAQLVVDRKPSAIANFRDYKNQHLPLTDIMPEGLEFCDFPPVKTILEQPTEVAVDESSFSDIMPLIPDLILEWRNSLDTQLIEVIKKEDATARIRGPYRLMMSILWDGYDDYDDDDRSYSPRPPLDEDTLPDMLKLATTVFECGACSRSSHIDSSSESTDEFEDNFLGYSMYNVCPLFYPKVLGHLCLTRKKRSVWSWEPAPEPAKRLDISQKVRRRWTSRPLRLDRRLGRCVEALQTQAGLDPNTTTVDDMDNLGIWFACLRCVYPTTNRKKGLYETDAFMWRDAVKHHGVRHGCDDPLWRKLDTEEKRQAREAYEAIFAKSVETAVENEPRNKSWLCVHCRDTQAEIESTELDVMKAHLLDRHDIQEPELDKDYYKDYAAVPIFPPRCTVVIDLK